MADSLSARIRWLFKWIFQVILVVSLLTIIYLVGFPTKQITHVLAFKNSTDSGTSSNDEKVKFQLFTRKNLNQPQILIPGNLTLLEQSNFNKFHEVKIYAHGFGGGPMSSYGAKHGYLQIQDCNFIAVDWSILAANPYEVVGSEYVPVAGRMTGKLIDFLVDQGALLSSFHLIGFSMGAHVVGIAGSTATKGKIPRITGLDPADAYFFNKFDKDHRLDVSDGEYVDVIHTSSRTDKGPIGHADFFPNGGIVQPGCQEVEIGCCNHCRAVTLFAESVITKNGFLSVLCDSWDQFKAGQCQHNQVAYMGNPLNKTARGSFFLKTHENPPYALESTATSNQR